MYEQILAENPSIPAKEALALSRRMMNGSKWRTFLLDLSFLPWFFAGVFSFGALFFLYINPYRKAVFAELYMTLRASAKKRKLPGSDYFNDIWLSSPPPPEMSAVFAENFTCQVYPMPLFTIPREREARFHPDYRRDYSPLNLVLLFFVFSFIGWFWESLIFSPAAVGRVVNRGTMYGPWLPVYGVGGLAILVLLKPVREKPLALFFLSMAICGLIEYGAATFLWIFRHLRYWDYTGYFFNLQGRVCLEGLLVFGTGCSAGVYFLAPLLDSLALLIPKKARSLAAAALVGLFIVDFIFTQLYPRSGFGITN
jgi:hypothetical protein